RPVLVDLVAAFGCFLAVLGLAAVLAIFPAPALTRVLAGTLAAEVLAADFPPFLAVPFAGVLAFAFGAALAALLRCFGLVLAAALAPCFADAPARASGPCFGALAGFCAAGFAASLTTRTGPAACSAGA